MAYRTTSKSIALKILFRFFVLLLAVAGPSQAFSQLILGARITANHNWQKYDEGTNAANADLSVWGMGASVTALYRLSSRFAVGVEPGFVQRGTKCEPGFVLPYPGDAKLVCNFIDLPIVAEASRGLWKDRLLLSGKLGGGVSRLVSGYREISSFNPEVPVDRNELALDNEPQLRCWEKGLMAGLGLGFKLGPGFVNLESRYYHGLTDANKNLTSKNRSLGYSLGYRLSL